jgi:hypothetical protein
MDKIYECKKLEDREIKMCYLAYLWKNNKVVTNEMGYDIPDAALLGFDLFEDYLTQHETNRQRNIDNELNPIIVFLLKFFNQSPNVIRLTKERIKKYLEIVKNNLNQIIDFNVQKMVEYQQTYVQTIRKINVVANRTDGKIVNSNPTIYNLSSNPTYNTLISDYVRLKPTLESFNNLLKSKNIAFGTYSGDFTLLDFDGNEADKNFFLFMSQEINGKNKEKNDFINFILEDKTLSTTKDPVNFEKKLRKITEMLQTKYNQELRKEVKMFEDIEKSKEYKEFTDGIQQKMYVKNKERNIEYSTTEIPAIVNQQKELIFNLYRTTNVDNSNTFTNKITFN